MTDDRQSGGITRAANVRSQAGDESRCEPAADPLGSAPTSERGGAAQPVSMTSSIQHSALLRTTHADPRVMAAWCEWLDALGTDAEAALAAAMAYKQLDSEARDSWLSALEQDVPRLKVPLIAVYAPLLAVELDPERRARITAAIGPGDVGSTPQSRARALCGLLRDGTRVAAVVCPLYLDFVQVLACAYRSGEGFAWVRHDPIVQRSAAPEPGQQLGGVQLESTPLKPLIDELAHTVLAHTRSGRAIPEALRAFADLFGPGDAGEASDEQS